MEVGNVQNYMLIRPQDDFLIDLHIIMCDFLHDVGLYFDIV